MECEAPHLLHAKYGCRFRVASPRILSLTELCFSPIVFFIATVSSEMFPFAGHAEYGYSLDYAEKELKEAGDTAKRLGVRLTTHPGQFNQLGS